MAETLVTEDPSGAVVERLVAATGHVVITGGSTPRSAYERLEPRGDVSFWFTDERCVPPDHEHSNYGMVKGALLDRVGANAHRMRGELGPDEGSEEYAEEIRGELGDGIPEFDLMLVGLGPDAHICSLFPRDAALGVRDRTVVGVDTPGMPPLVPRITLTLPVVNAAREVVFLVTGEDKADAVHRAFAGPPDPDVPGSLVEAASVTAILDPPAAARL